MNPIMRSRFVARRKPTQNIIDDFELRNQMKKGGIVFPKDRIKRRKLRRWNNT